MKMDINYIAKYRKKNNWVGEAATKLCCYYILDAYKLREITMS